MTEIRSIEYSERGMVRVVTLGGKRVTFSAGTPCMIIHDEPIEAASNEPEEQI